MRRYLDIKGARNIDTITLNTLNTNVTSDILSGRKKMFVAS